MALGIGGTMKNATVLLAGIAAIAALTIQAASAQTDIVRKPSDWRGTLMEGTDALVATDRHGYPLFIQSGETIGTVFEPAPMPGEQLAAEFKKLCIDTEFDELKLASVATGSALGLSRRTIEIPAQKAGEASFHANLWTSPAARVQIWSGDAPALNKRQTLSRWRNGATASVFRPSAAPGPSCGLTVMTTGFHSPAAFLAAMEGLLAAKPAKAVTKEQWADGHWTVAGGGGGETRVTYSMTDLNKAEQLLHIAVVRRAK